MEIIKSHRLSLRQLLFTLIMIGVSYSSMGQASLEAINKTKATLLQSTSDSSRIVLLSNLAGMYRFSNIDSSLAYTNTALALAKKINLLKWQATILSLKGATLLETGRLPESLQLQFEAINIGKKINDQGIIAMAFNRIGNTYMELADYKKANEYYFLSKSFFSEKEGLYYNELSNIGNIYELLHQPDSALHCLQIVYKASIKNRNNRRFIVRPEMMFRLGNAYKLKGDKQKALNFYKQGIQEAINDNDIRNLTMNNLLLAKLYHEMNHSDSSMKYANHALQSGKSVLFRKGVYEASLLVSEIFKSKKKYDSAYKYLEVANVERDSLIGPKRFRELQRIVLNEQQRQRDDENKRVEEQNNRKQYALLAGFVIFLIVAAILYLNNKQKQKANKVLEKTLTNLKSTQSQLIQSEKMASLGELTAGIAHEIQNPLNFVNNFSEVSTELIDEMNSELAKGNLELVTEISKDLKDNLTKINHHGKRAGSIVSGMLQHSRTSKGVKEPTEINALADEYLRLAYHGLRAKDKDFNATMKTEFDETIGKLNIVPQDIGRVILNLITNAFYVVNEKSKQGIADYEATVTVITKRSPLPGRGAGGEAVIITVKDNGNGIPQKILDKIFQPFFTTKPTGQGTGLGLSLSLSYDIVKAHGGEIKVETEENTGTSFTIQLPIS